MEGGVVGVLFLTGGIGASLEVVRGDRVGLVVVVLGGIKVDVVVLGVWRAGEEAFGALFLVAGAESSFEV